MLREQSAARGPLILAKSVKCGLDTDAILAAGDINEGGWSVTAEPLQAKGVWGAWRLGFERGGERRTVDVCDYSSAGEWAKDKIEFSIFF